LSHFSQTWFPIADIQVFTPIHKGTVGAGKLNTELQKALNPGELGLTRGASNFKGNDKVMQINNNYDKEMFNGDIGRIRGIDTENQEVIIPILTQHYVLLQRNLAYTGVTWGRKLVVMIGMKRALAIGVKNNKTQKRYTHLRARLSPFPSYSQTTLPFLTGALV
jgi:exodeoxyribonuclease V alpha subunit